MKSIAADFDANGNEQLAELHQQAGSFVQRQKHKKSEGTAKARRIGLKRFFRWDDLIHPSEMTPFDIEEFLFHLIEEDYANSTVKSTYFGLKVFLDHLEAKGEIEENPAEDVSLSKFTALSGGSKKSKELKAKGGISYLELDELRTLREHAGDGPGNALRNELIIRLLFQTGLRRGEFCEIELDDIDRDNRSIRIHAEKTYKNRVVGYQPSLDFLMNQWIDGGYRDSILTAPDSDYLFPTKSSEQFSTTAMNRMVKQVADAADIQATVYEDHAGSQRTKVTSHTLRHSFAVHSLKNGMDIRSLQKAMGHGKLSTTEQYLEVTSDDVLTELGKFGPDSSE